MKAREAFSAAITFIMDETDRICSFGYHKFDLLQGPISAILYGIGKLCRYTFGLIIGIFAASFAYGFTALKNWFSYEKSRKINETEATQEQIESSELQISAENNVAAILKKEDLELKIRLLVDKLNLKISDLKRVCPVALEEKLAEYEATLQQEAERLIQAANIDMTKPEEVLKKLMPIAVSKMLNLMPSNPPTNEFELAPALEPLQKDLENLMQQLNVQAENIDMTKVEKVVTTVMSIAVSKMLHLMSSNPPSNEFELALALERLKKDLENLMQQLNAQPTQNELSNLLEQYTFLLNKIKCFWPDNPEKQRAKEIELPANQADKHGIMLTGSFSVEDNTKFFSTKRTQEKSSHVDAVTQIPTLNSQF